MSRIYSTCHGCCCLLYPVSHQEVHDVLLSHYYWCQVWFQGKVVIMSLPKCLFFLFHQNLGYPVSHPGMVLDWVNNWRLNHDFLIWSFHLHFSAGILHLNLINYEWSWLSSQVFKSHLDFSPSELSVFPWGPGQLWHRVMRAMTRVGTWGWDRAGKGPWVCPT